jgi:hypothetical protein
MDNQIIMRVCPQAFPETVTVNDFRKEVHPVTGAPMSGYYVLLPVCPKLEDRVDGVIPGIWVKVDGLTAYELVKGGWFIEYLDDLTYPSDGDKYYANITPTNIVL